MEICCQNLDLDFGFLHSSAVEVLCCEHFDILPHVWVQLSVSDKYNKMSRIEVFSCTCDNSRC